MSGGAKIAVTVAAVEPLNDLVTRFRFVRADGGALPAFSGGSHVVVEMDDHGVRRQNPYSLSGDPADTSGYEISVRRDDSGRGGSLFMHRHVVPGMTMRISQPVNLFPLDRRAKKHLMIAGGIGITPFLAQTAQLAAEGGRYELHYCTRSAALASHADALTARHGGRVHHYHDDRGEMLPLDALLAGQPLGTHLYVCGPKPMILWVRRTAAAAGWPDTAVHDEAFLAPPPGAPFDVVLAASTKTIHVGAQQSLLEAMEAAGVDAPYLCRGGACGQCETQVIACDGMIVHNDHWLTEAQRSTGDRIMPCVSRFAGRRLVLDR